MEMQWNDVSCGVIVRERSDMGSPVAHTIEDYGLSLLQHSLSQ
jgi:hypothetical protein